MEKLLYSKGDDRSIDSSCLQNTVKKLVSNLCETLIFYRTHLRIEGTVGITIDDERVIVLHFGENIKSTCLQNDSDLKRSSYEPENSLNSGADESKQEARKCSAKNAAAESATVSEEAKLKPMPPIVTDCESDGIMLSESSPSEPGKIKIPLDGNSSFCEPHDNLPFSGKSYNSRGHSSSSFGGRSEMESATLLDMTTDILSNLFSGDNRDAGLGNYYDKGQGRADEPIQGCKMRQGSAIEALRQLYSKRFSSPGTLGTQQKYLDPDIYPGTQDHLTSISNDSSGKISSVGRKECTQNQVLLRELLFQKTNLATDPLNVQPPAAKRRRFAHGNKTNTSTSVANLLIQNNSSAGTLGQKSGLPAFCIEERGTTSQRETSSPETGLSTFPPAMTFDQDTDSSNYKFSQLLFSLVDNKRHGMNHSNPSTNSEQRQSSNSASKSYDSTLYQTALASETASVKQEADDSEYDLIERSSFGS